MRLLPRRVSLALVFSAGAFAATTGIDEPLRFDDLVRQGRAAFLAFDIDRAQAVYNEACPAELVPVYPLARSVTCENLLASVDEVRGNLIRAEQRFLQAVSRAEQAGTAYQPLYCAKLIDLGSFFHRRGRIAEAEFSLRKASDLARQLTGVMPELLPKALIRLGSLYAGSMQVERGRAVLLEALESPNLRGNELATAQTILGKLELAAGNAKLAESHLREAASLAVVSLGDNHPVTAAYQTNLAMALIAQREFSRARPLLRRAQFVLEAQPGTPRMELAVVCSEMSDLASGEGKLAEAEEYARRAIAILNRQPAPHRATVATAEVMLAGIYLQRHDIRAADEMLTHAIQVQRDALVSSRTLAVSLQLLAGVRVQQRDWPAAEALYREAIVLCRKESLADFDPSMARLLHGLADALKHRMGQENEIRMLENQAREMDRSIRGPNYLAGSRSTDTL